MVFALYVNIVLGYFMASIQSPDFSLSDYRWENRIILLFHSNGNSQYKKQTDELLNDKPGLSDRNLLIFSIDQTSKITELTTSKKFESKPGLRSDFNIPQNEFYVILIGKDGSVKYRDNSPIERKKLYAIIDAMPMRQAEMRRKN